MNRFLASIVGSVVEAAAELRIHRTRVLLSLIGVAVAVAALTAVVGLSSMARQSSAELLEAGGGRPATLSASFYSNSGATIDAEAINAAVATAAERYDISYLSQNSYAGVRVQFTDGTQDVGLQLVGPDYATMHRVAVAQGMWFADNDAERLAPALIINDSFWKMLGSPDLRTHPTATIVGTTKTTGVIIGVLPPRQYDDYPNAMVLADSFAEFADPTALAQSQPQWEFWVPADIADELQDRLKSDFKAVLGKDINNDVYRNDYAANGQDPFGPITLVASGIAVLILFLGALSLVNISLVTVRQRIREIGIRRSFGATAGRVFFAVMMESVVGTVAAGVVGVFVAVVVVKNPMVLNLIAPGVIDVPPFPLDAALIGLASATAVGALAGLLPALVAVRVKVIDAIRY